MLDAHQLAEFNTQGHLTVPGLFDSNSVADACCDIEAWSREFLDTLSDEQRRWYIERDDAGGATLRKLDEPVYSRPVFRALARDPQLVDIVEQILGNGVSVFYSQVFCKPPEVGGPKPIHQDNFYFGPDNADGTLTVWIALDDATVENGCLFYGDGSHRGEILPHEAPADEPFNLQIPCELLGRYSMTAAPVPAGGISLHHGNTWHQSASNRSEKPRRAVAMHFIAKGTSLVRPALSYDTSVIVLISKRSNG